MRIFGFSALTLFVIFVAFVLGTKMPNALSSVPVIGSL